MVVKHGPVFDSPPVLGLLQEGRPLGGGAARSTKHKATRKPTATCVCVHSLRLQVPRLCVSMRNEPPRRSTRDVSARHASTACVCRSEQSSASSDACSARMPSRMSERPRPRLRGARAFAVSGASDRYLIAIGASCARRIRRSGAGAGAGAAAGRGTLNLVDDVLELLVRELRPRHVVAHLPEVATAP
jgi:hypothetical protein